MNWIGKRMLDVEELAIPGVFMLKPWVFEDERGSFCETYNAERFSDAGLDAVFVQDNQSMSTRSGTVRGLHYQAPPFAQAKLVRVLSGAVFDVAVDVRAGSPTFGTWVGAELTAEGAEQIFVPRGFLHGFITRAPNTCVAYKVDNYYNQEADGAVAWNSTALSIDWGVAESNAILSDKDAGAPDFANWTSPFSFETNSTN